MPSILVIVITTFSKYIWDASANNGGNAGMGYENGIQLVVICNQLNSILQKVIKVLDKLRILLYHVVV